MIIDILLLFFLVVCAMVAVEMMDLLSATLIMGAYSLIMALVWTRLNAVDVAFTEATVGAGITTVLVLAALSRTKRGEAELTDITLDNNLRSETSKLVKKHNVISLLVVVITGAVLIYGTMDMPDFGDPNAPAHNHVAPYMLENGEHDTVSENIVTSVLASYRGFDTLGETSVVLTAVLSVILILRRKKERKNKGDG